MRISLRHVRSAHSSMSHYCNVHDDCSSEFSPYLCTTEVTASAGSIQLIATEVDRVVRRTTTGREKWLGLLLPAEMLQVVGRAKRASTLR